MEQPVNGRVHALGYHRLSGAATEALCHHAHPGVLHDGGLHHLSLHRAIVQP